MNRRRYSEDQSVQKPAAEINEDKYKLLRDGVKTEIFDYLFH